MKKIQCKIFAWGKSTEEEINNWINKEDPTIKFVKTWPIGEITVLVIFYVKDLD